MELKRQGVDVISLSVGEPDFGPPEVGSRPSLRVRATEFVLSAVVESEVVPQCVVQATGDAARNGYTKYSATAGTFELRTKISQHLCSTRGLSYSPEQVLLSGGAKQSIYQAMMVCCSPGDEVIVVAPYWVSYVEQAKLAGANVVVIHTTADQDYLATAEQLEKALTQQSRLLVLCNPSNPTGALYNLEQLQSIAEVRTTA